MTFYIGQKKAGEIFLGDKKIGRIYLGQTLVHMTKVVSKPTFLECIEFDGASWIDTGILPKGLETTVRYDFEPLVVNALSGILGSRVALHKVDYMFFMYSQGERLRLDWGGYRELYYPIKVNKRYLIETTIGEVFINGESVKTYEPRNDTSDYPFYIGTFNNGGSAYKSCQQKVYGCQFFESDVLVGDFRPCIDPKGVVCFYDTVTKKYFYNQGTGELKAGGRFVESIVFDGNSWIDTSFKPHPHTTRTVLDCMLLDNTSSGGQGIFGSRPNSTSSINSMNIWFNTSDAPKKLRLDCTGNYQTINTDIVDITQRLLIDCLDNEATVNGVTYSANVDKSNTTYLAYSMYLGNFNNAGSPYTKGCKMNCYGFAIYDNDTLAHDFRPYVDSDGVACFKDVVTDTLFYNKGTGTLTYTE